MQLGFTKPENSGLAAGQPPHSGLAAKAEFGSRQTLLW